jgi:hypothetical protein
MQVPSNYLMEFINELWITLKYTYVLLSLICFSEFWYIRHRLQALQLCHGLVNYIHLTIIISLSNFIIHYLLLWKKKVSLCLHFIFICAVRLCYDIKYVTLYSTYMCPNEREESLQRVHCLFLFDQVSICYFFMLNFNVIFIL